MDLSPARTSVLQPHHEQSQRQDRRQGEGGQNKKEKKKHVKVEGDVF